MGPDGTPRLFRPHMNMARMARSTARVALPVNILLTTSTEYSSIIVLTVYVFSHLIQIRC